MMKFCPNCGNEFSKTDKFCANCGSTRILDNNISAVNIQETAILPIETPVNSKSEVIVHPPEMQKKDEILLVASIFVDGQLKYGLVDKNGNWVSQPIFDRKLYEFDDKDY